MRRFSQRSGYSTLAELNMTPLIDLAFTLLIIFMITTPLLEQSINLNLPSAEPSTSQPAAKSVKTISVTPTGDLYLDQQPLTKAQLYEALAAFKAEDPEASVILRVDREAFFQYANDVFDAMTRAGITRMAIVNTPEAKR